MNEIKRILSIQSNVVYGYAGNKIAVFPMQSLGIDVLPINTVQLSSNTVYSNYEGSVLEAGQITKIINSLEKIGILASIDAVISGYIGSAAQGLEILNAVKTIKKYNPKALYFCDPVMGGDLQKGCVVAPEIVTFFKEQAIFEADFITPNLVELQTLTQFRFRHFDEIKAKLIQLQQKCPNIIVKNLLHASKTQDQFEMILAQKKELWHIARPFYPFKHRPLGAGDLICSVFAAQLVNQHTSIFAFEYAANVANEVLKITYEKNARELELIAARSNIIHPNLQYRADLLT